MLALLTLAMKASASPLPFPVFTSEWYVNGALYGGVDVWDSEVIGLAESRLAMGGGFTRAGLWQSWYSGDFLVWMPDSPADSHLAEVEWRGGRPLSPGAALTVRGSGSGGWVELAPAPSLTWSGASTFARLRVGPALRAGMDDGLGLAATALFAGALSPRVGLDLRLEARGWRHEVLPALALEGDLGLRWSAAPALSLQVLGGASHAGPGQTADARLYWSGNLPPEDALILRSLAIGRLRVGERAQLQLELAADRGVGSLDYTRLKAVAGVGLRLGRLSTPAALPEAGPTAFTFDAAQAQEVSLLGSFNGWEPAPMERGEGGLWSLTLTLEAGTYEYVYLVDGAAVAPPECERQRDDGFGGTNGVLVIVADGG